MYEVLKPRCITDEHLNLMQKRVWIPANAFIQGQTSGASVILNTDASGSTGTLVGTSVGAAQLPLIKFTATTENTDLLWKLPYDVDNRQPMRFRTYWTSDYGTANGTVTWKLLYNALLPNVMPIVGATALTSAWTASTKVSATGSIPYWTGYGVIAPLNTGANAYSLFDPRTEFLALRLSVASVTGLTLGTHFAYSYGLEISYTPKTMFGNGSSRAGLFPESNLSQVAADPAIQPQ